MFCVCVCVCVCVCGEGDIFNAPFDMQGQGRANIFSFSLNEVQILKYMQLYLLFILLFIANLHYIFRPNWPCSGVQVGLARQLLLAQVLF
jgi:hypothetical protein